MGCFSPFYFMMTKSPWWGAQTSLHCCLMPLDNIENGCYYSDCAVKKEKMPDKWQEEAVKLWDISEETVK